jgi:hypothetical protein
VRRVFARQAALLLLAAALLPSALRAGTMPDRADLRNEIDQTRKTIEGIEKGSFANYGEPDSLVALSRFWTLLQRWTGEFMNANPRAWAR